MTPKSCLSGKSRVDGKRIYALASDKGANAFANALFAFVNKFALIFVPPVFMSPGNSACAF